MLQIDNGAEIWLRRYAVKNSWKVSHFAYEIDDLIQDGYLSWYICADRYNQVTDYRHMCSLFKMTFTNRIRELSMTDKDNKFNFMLEGGLSDLVDPSMQGLSESWILDKVCGHYMQTTGSVGQIISDAVEPVKTVLRFLVSAEGIAVMRRPFRLRLDGRRETTNFRIYRALGLEPQGDLMGLTKSYILNYV